VKLRRATNTRNNLAPKCTNEKGIAALLDKSPRYVRYLADEKVIPCIQLPGRDRIYDIEKVFAALNRFEVEAVGQPLLHKKK
jgi:hypothetical protein